MPKLYRICPCGLISNRKCVSNVSIIINSQHHTHMDLLSNQKHSSQEKLSLDRKQENAKVVVTEKKKISQINLHFYSPLYVQQWFHQIGGQIWLKNTVLFVVPLYFSFVLWIHLRRCGKSGSLFHISALQSVLYYCSLILLILGDLWCPGSLLYQLA